MRTPYLVWLLRPSGQPEEWRKISTTRNVIKATSGVVWCGEGVDRDGELSVEEGILEGDVVMNKEESTIVVALHKHHTVDTEWRGITEKRRQGNCWSIHAVHTSSAAESFPFILGLTLLSTAETIASAPTLRAMRNTMFLSLLPSTTLGTIDRTVIGKNVG